MMQQISALQNINSAVIDRVSEIFHSRKCHHYTTICELHGLYQLAIHSFYFQFHVLLSYMHSSYRLDRHESIRHTFFSFSISLFNFFFKHCTIFVPLSSSVFSQFRRNRHFRRWQWSVFILSCD
jgi:hypothetical protein